jgi:transposase
MTEELFGELPTQMAPQVEDRGAPRLVEPRRDQIELRPMDLESLVPLDHLVRVIWGMVVKLDLSELEDRIKAREHRAGHPATSPRLLMALWLYAVIDGVGSARALAGLCGSHDIYRWLCGGVSVNHHTLGDFRVSCADLLDRLLVEHLAALANAKLIDLDALAQDGVRIRANAGAASFRRESTLAEHLKTAEEVVQKLKQELESDPNASSARIKAAKERAAREHCENLEAAQKALAEIKQQREERGRRDNGKPGKEPPASTTDPDARVMKMADGGFRPAYNVQVASPAGMTIVVTLDISNNGSDRGQMRPMLERVCERIGRLPAKHFADGGFASAPDIEWAHGQGVQVYCPPTKTKHGTDPYAPREDDGEGVAGWRERMKSDAGKEEYKIRSICECIHARFRNWNLLRMPVRGVKKVRAVVLWYAFANNIMEGHRLAVPAAAT